MAFIVLRLKKIIKGSGEAPPSGSGLQTTTTLTTNTSRLTQG